MPDLTNPDYFAEFIGSFWNRVFAGNQLAHGVASFSSSALLDQYQWLVEAVERLSIDTVKATAVQKSRPVIFRQSEFSVGPEKLTIGRGQSIGPQPAGTEFREGAAFSIDGLERRSGRYYIGVDSAIVSIGPVIINSLKEPSLVWIEGVDFVFSDGIIAFKTNPFEDPRIPRRRVPSDNVDGGEDEIILWMTDVKTDSGEFSQHYGFAAPGLKPGTPEYFDGIKACMRAIAEGPTTSAIDHLIATVLGLPCTREAKETILSISNFGDEQLVATNLGVYLIKSGLSLRPEVIVGAVLEAGHPLSTGSEVFDRTSKTQWWAELDGLLLGESFFDKRVTSAIGFLNETCPVILGASSITSDGIDLRSATFHLVGKKSNVDLFWDITTENSLSQGRPLGNALYRQRGLLGGGGNPDFSQSLLINPLQFLAENLMRDSVVVVRIRDSSTLPITNLFQIAPLLKSLLPAWLGFVVVADVRVQDGVSFHLNNNPANSISLLDPSPTQALLRPGSAPLEIGTRTQWAAVQPDGTPTSRIHEAISVDRSAPLMKEVVSFGNPSANVVSYGQSFTVCEESVETHLTPSCKL
jgi:hypothetical protein